MNCINEYNEEMILTYHDRNALKGRVLKRLNLLYSVKAFCVVFRFEQLDVIYFPYKLIVVVSKDLLRNGNPKDC